MTSLFLLAPAGLRAQNVVTSGGAGPVLLPAAAGMDWTLRLCSSPPAVRVARMVSAAHRPRAHAEAVEEIHAKLRAEVQRFLDGEPLCPWVHVLGIAGVEVYFDHPAAAFYSLSLAAAFLEGELRERLLAYLAGHFERFPPHAEEGYPPLECRRREPYRLPDAVVLRHRGPRKARSAFGVYALWLYATVAGRPELLEREAKAARRAVARLLSSPPEERREREGDDGEELLNGDIAGLIGFIRICRAAGEPEEAAGAAERLEELLTRRLNLEREAPRLVRPTRSVSGNWHHAGKIPRYLDLVPEVARLLAERSDGVERRRLRFFAESMPSWHLAYGERFIGGENYTSPAHLSRAGFTAHALLGEADAAHLASLLDVPWVRGDLYFIEKCALAMWAAQGRSFELLAE